MNRSAGVVNRVLDSVFTNGLRRMGVGSFTGKGRGRTDGRKGEKTPSSRGPTTRFDDSFQGRGGRRVLSGKLR